MMALIGLAFLLCLLIGYLFGLHDGAQREHEWLRSAIKEAKSNTPHD